MPKASSAKKTRRPTLVPGANSSSSRRKIQAEPPCTGDMDVDNDDLQCSPLALTQPSMFCCFCGDFGGRENRNLHTCNTCGAMMCMQVAENGAGCIAYRSLAASELFYCPHCHRKRDDGHSEDPLPYVFTGYGSRNHARMPWPMVLVNCFLTSQADDQLASALVHNLEGHYIWNVTNFCIRKVGLKTNAQTMALRELVPATAFLKASVDLQLPANTFIVVDTHSDGLTGFLQVGGGFTSPKHCSITELLNAFIGLEFKEAMKSTSKSASEDKPSVEDNDRWYKRSVYWRGGWRCLVICSCGPAMRVSSHFDKVRQLVDNNTFDLVIGFGGSSTLPTQVRDVISNIIEALGVNKTADLWSSVCNAVIRNHGVLQNNSIVAIFKERGLDTRVFAREITLHNPPQRFWGTEFQGCKNGCNPTPGEVILKTKDKGRYRIICCKCKWRSGWVRVEDVFKTGQLHPVSRKVTDVFWHPYPTPPVLQAVFVNVA